MVLCGYDNPLYRELLADWQLHSTTARISGGRGTSLRTECIWINQACAANLELGRTDLFTEHTHA